MNKLMVLVLILVSSTTIASEKCSDTVYGKVASGYVFQDLGLMATTKPVFQGGNTVSCGKWSFDVWTSAQLSGGKYGKRGLGDEWDFSVFYDTQFSSTALQLSAQYYSLSFTKSLWNTQDDLVEVYADISRAVELGHLKVMPFLRVIEWFGTDTDINPAATVIRPGIRFAAELGHGFSVNGDVSKSLDVTDNIYVDRLEVTLGKAVGKLNLQAGLKATEGSPSVWSTGFIYTFK